MVYLINLLLVPIYYVVINNLFRKNKKIIFFLLVGLHAILFRALANPYVYVDTDRYAYAFEFIADMKFEDVVLSLNRYSEWGPGYLALNWLISRFSSNPMYLFIILSVLSVGGVLLYYYKNTVVPLITVLLYLLYPMMYLMGFGVVRQHLSVVFLLWALYFADKLKISIPLAIVGILCHTSSLIFLPFYFIRHLGIRKFNSYKLVTISISGFLLLSISVTYVISFLSRYEDKLESENEQYNITPFIVIGSLLVMFLVTRILHKIEGIKDQYIVRFVIYGFVIAIFGMTVPKAGRLTLPFIYCMPVAISLLYKYANKRDRMICNLYTAGLFFVILRNVFIGIDRYREYMFIWENI